MPAMPDHIRSEAQRFRPLCRTGEPRIYHLLCLGLTPPDRKEPYSVKRRFSNNTPSIFPRYEVPEMRICPVVLYESRGSQVSRRGCETKHQGYTGGQGRVRLDGGLDRAVPVGGSLCCGLPETGKHVCRLFRYGQQGCRRGCRGISRCPGRGAAYHAEQLPPDNMRMRRNVVVKYAPIRMNYYCGLDEGKHNVEGGLISLCPPSLTQVPSQLQKWTAIAITSASITAR